MRRRDEWKEKAYLGCRLHEDRDVGSVTAGANKVGEVVVTDVSNVLHLQPNLGGDG